MGVEVHTAPGGCRSYNNLPCGCRLLEGVGRSCLRPRQKLRSIQQTRRAGVMTVQRQTAVVETAELAAAAACSCSDASIYRKYRFDIVSNQPRKYRNFRYTVVDFLCIVLPNFHVWCQEVV